MGNLLPDEWRLISDLKGNASMNMAIDEAIAKSYLDSKPTIRFYTWEKPAVSIGYFQRIMPVINWLNYNPPFPPFNKGGEIDVVRRPTGGGIVLHGTDLTYSVAVKSIVNTRNLIPFFYREFGGAVIEGLRLLGIRNAECGVRSKASEVFSPNSEPRTPNSKDLSLCAQTPVESDVLVEGIKIAGCAARRFQETPPQKTADSPHLSATLLFQGYVSLCRITDMMLQHVTDAIIKGFALALDIKLVHGELTDGELVLAEELNNRKYSRNEWNYKR